jgi:hypothetical protein
MGSIWDPEKYCSVEIYYGLQIFSWDNLFGPRSKKSIVSEKKQGLKVVYPSSRPPLFLVVQYL